MRRACHQLVVTIGGDGRQGCFIGRCIKGVILLSRNQQKIWQGCDVSFKGAARSKGCVQSETVTLRGAVTVWAIQHRFGKVKLDHMKMIEGSHPDSVQHR